LHSYITKQTAAHSSYVTAQAVAGLTAAAAAHTQSWASPHAISGGQSGNETDSPPQYISFPLSASFLQRSILIHPPPTTILSQQLTQSLNNCFKKDQILKRSVPVEPEPEPVEDLRNRFRRIDGDNGAGLEWESGPHVDSVDVNSSALSEDMLRDLLICTDPAIFCSGISAKPLIFSISAVYGNKTTSK